MYTYFQECINKLTFWSQTCKLSISHKKCCILQVGTVASDCNHDYYIESVPVVQVDVVKDLGIFVDKSLKFDHHINNVARAALTRANLIHKCFISKDITVMTRAFLTYVRPLLEYASCVWSPYLLKHIKRTIESVQKWFTKRLPNISHLGYTERLKATGLDSLELR